MGVHLEFAISAVRRLRRLPYKCNRPSNGHPSGIDPLLFGISQYRITYGSFLYLPCRQMKVERATLTITENVDSKAKTTSAAANCMIFRLVGIDAGEQVA